MKRSNGLTGWLRWDLRLSYVRRWLGVFAIWGTIGVAWSVLFVRSFRTARWPIHVAVELAASAAGAAVYTAMERAFLRWIRAKRFRN